LGIAGKISAVEYYVCNVRCRLGSVQRHRSSRTDHHARAWRQL